MGNSVILRFTVYYCPMDQNDAELVGEYLSGDLKALNFLIARHTPALYRFVFRLVGSEADAQDLIQETWVKVWKNLSKYDRERPFLTWLFKIARNTVIDRLRERKDLTFSQLDKDKTDEDISFADNLPDQELLPDELFARQELGAELASALAQLPADRRLIVVLHLENELTFEEIAIIIDKPLNTVKSQYRRAVLKLREILTLNLDPSLPAGRQSQALLAGRQAGMTQIPGGEPAPKGVVTPYKRV